MDYGQLIAKQGAESTQQRNTVSDRRPAGSLRKGLARNGYAFRQRESVAEMSEHYLEALDLGHGLHCRWIREAHETECCQSAMIFPADGRCSQRAVALRGLRV
jgi:hypothetical protein